MLSRRTVCCAHDAHASPCDAFGSKGADSYALGNGYFAFTQFSVLFAKRCPIFCMIILAGRDQIVSEAALHSELSDLECKGEEEMVIVRFFFVVRSSPRGVSL